MAWAAGLLVVVPPAAEVRAQGERETTAESELALQRGLEWLARHQGPEGNWSSDDLGLVSLGALAFMAGGQIPGHGKFSASVERALDFVIRRAQPSGLLNIADPKRDLYNHGLATFVLSQAYGLYDEPRLAPALDLALRLLVATQCDDGGWDYYARRQERGHDLSLVALQAAALRSTADCGFDAPAEVLERALRRVRGYYRARGAAADLPESALRRQPGQFTYDGARETLAMAACGVACLQAFEQRSDWRIAKNLEPLRAQLLEIRAPGDRHGRLPFDAYTLFYVGQAVYQAGGRTWREGYPPLRDAIAAAQLRDAVDPSRDGRWLGDERLAGRPAELFSTAVACFVLALPNRFLPALEDPARPPPRGGSPAKD
jgi:hypothetical protein